MPGANVGGFNWTHITTATTTTIFSGVGASQASATSPANTGVLQDVVVNTLGTTPVISVYDAPTAVAANLIAVITPVANGNQFGSPIQLKAGLTIVTTGSGFDITVLWA